MSLSDWQYEYLTDQLHRTANKKHECYVLSVLFHDPRLQELKPITQHYVKAQDRYLLLDLYYPQLNVAVEVDEPYHVRNGQSDYLRQQLVEEKSNCAFERISIAGGNVPAQIERLKDKLVAKIAEVKASAAWQPWMPPKQLSLAQAKQMFSKTLFVKILGNISEEKLLARQTGNWRIAKHQRDRIAHVIVVHNGRISAVFDKPEWESRNGKWGYNGKLILDSELLESQITDWKARQTITYSIDMYRPIRSKNRKAATDVRIEKSMAGVIP